MTKDTGSTGVTALKMSVREILQISLQRLMISLKERATPERAALCNAVVREIDYFFLRRYATKPNRTNPVLIGGSYEDLECVQKPKFA